MNECKSCGSPLEGNPLASQSKCSYCGRVNFNEQFVGLYAQNIDFTKTHNLLEVGMAAFHGQDYAKARDAFERVLLEDSRSQEAWVYAAMSIANLTDLSNMDVCLGDVESYLKKAAEMGGRTEILEVGESVARNAIGRTVLRAIRRHREVADKKYFAYESVNRAKAVSDRDQELTFLYKYAECACQLVPDDPAVIGPVSVEVLLAARHGGCPAGLRDAATRALNDIKEKNGQLYQSLAGDLAPARRSSSPGCGSGKTALLVIWAADIVRMIGNGGN